MHEPTAPSPTREEIVIEPGQPVVPPPHVRAEIEEMLRNDPSRTGDCFRAIERDEDAEGMKTAVGSKYPGVVWHYERLIKALRDGDLPTAPTVIRSVSRKFRTVLKTDDLSEDARLVLSSNFVVLDRRAADRARQKEETEAALTATAKTEAEATPGIYVYTLPHYLRYPPGLVREGGFGRRVAGMGREASKRQRPGWLLARICPLASMASQRWLDDLLKSHQPREMIVDLLVATDGRSLRDLLPPLSTLSGEAPLFELPTRSRNCLQRSGHTQWEQIVDLEPAHIRGFKNAGEQTERSVIAWCISQAEAVARSRPGDDSGKVGERSASTVSLDADATGHEYDQGGPKGEAWRDLEEHLATVFRAAADYRGAQSVADVLDGDLSGLLEATGLYKALSETRLEELVESAPVGPQLRSATRRLMEGCQPLEAALLEQRIHVEDPSTLAELGQQFDLTRERVRQIQTRVVSRLDNAVGTLLNEAIVLWGPTLPAITTADRLSALVREFLGSPSEPDGADGLAARCLIVGLGREPANALSLGDAAAKSLATLRRRASELADSVGLVAEADLLSEFDGLGASGYWDDLLEAAGLHRVGKSLALRTTGKAQIKAALLEIGRPATKEEIAEVCGLDVKGLGSQLSVIEDVARSDKHRWGLVGWIDDVYEGIPAEIMQRIEEDGGVTSVERLLEELPRLFGVSESSVRTYLATPQFTVRDGHVSIADPSTLKFRDLDDVIDGRTDDGQPYWLFTVEDRNLHGYSVLGFPPELARALGCGPNESVRVALVDPEGCEPLSLIWRLSTASGGASVGYLTEPLKRIGAVAGAIVRLHVRRDGRTALALEQGAPSAGAADAEDLLRRIKDRRRVI